MNQASIIQYSEYRAFLQDHVTLKKKSTKNWSLQVWSKRLGLKSSSSLSMIIKGKRSISISLAKKLAVYFKFNQEEIRHFYMLIQQEKISDSDGNLKIHFSQNENTRKPNQPFGPNDLEFNYFSWKTYAIRELTLLEDFSEDKTWISKKLNSKISPKEAQNIWDFLKSNELVIFNGNRWKPSTKTLDVKTRSSKDVENFHFELMEMAKGAIKVPFDERSLHSSTFAIKKDKVNELKILLKEFQENLSKIVESDNYDSVYHFNMMLFPL